ncbi:UNVERIFIED_CONTAM: hypothetical protein RMT77_016813 [Armadillidium vulgare]
MDIKHEGKFKVECVENSEDDKNINIHLEQLSALEQIQERNCYEFIDVKSEIEIKEEPFDVEEEETENEELERDCYKSIDMKSEIEIKEEFFAIEEEEAENEELERDCYKSIDMKSEIEVKEEQFDIVEEETANDECLDKICELDQNQVRIKMF